MADGNESQHSTSSTRTTTSSSFSSTSSSSSFNPTTSSSSFSSSSATTSSSSSFSSTSSSSSSTTTSSSSFSSSSSSSTTTSSSFSSTSSSSSSTTTSSSFSSTSSSSSSTPTTSSSIEWSQPCRSFEFSEILLATDNFNESLVIGQGGFGSVFKGNIVNGSNVVITAIKRLDSMSSQGASEFWTEVEMLSKLRHCHLVSLFGYCNYEKEMILVYEYMPNGTLEDHLHKLGTPLSWVQRLKICIGTARGLDYLHTGAGIEFGVIHRDVKSSNILLNESLAAKISDFGLSRISATNKPSTYVKTLVKGTFGYLDPNYYTTGRLTRKSDVFSFGVVLLEVLCRKRAVDSSLDEEQWGLVPWAQESIKQGNLKNIIDSGIRGQISPKCLKNFVRIAERCLHNNPKKRPTMAEVVVTLDSVLSLQQKIDNAAGKTIYGRMRDMFPFPFHGENSGHDDSRLSSNSMDNKDSTNPIPSFIVFKHSDLKMATKNFSNDLVIDRDDYGDVFLGWVDEKTFAPSTEGVGITVAVKTYWGDLSEWVEFLTGFGRLAHPNIISLLGYGDRGRDIWFLVYEYTNIQNQNFSHFLFGDVGEPLSWERRLMIMIGVARGLAYMQSSNEQVIHGGIKTSNILLDQNFNAKVGYFGVAKLHTKFRLLSSAKEKSYAIDTDTLRYIDQRDQLTGELTVESDIYSFGVVLFETLTGQRALKEGQYGFTLVKWVRPFLADKRKLKAIIDHRLNNIFPLEGAFECVTLATRCVAGDPKDRPSAEEILKTLEQIYPLNNDVIHTVDGVALDEFAFPLENSGHDDSRLSSDSKDNKDSTNPIPNLKVLEYSDLKMATRDFSQDLVIDWDGYGTVFLGWVDEKTFAPSTEGVGIPVAIKKYTEGLATEWEAVVTSFGRLSHPNIISLLGYSKYKRRNFLLVYEYMNRQMRLSDFLFGDVVEPLSWERRLMILVGVARGLAYMHGSKEQVVHSGIKTFNILLDQSYNAKLGYFGLPKFPPKIDELDGMINDITTIDKLDGMKDTPTNDKDIVRYLDPGDQLIGELTVKSDIYSFGVVLFETLTGQRARQQSWETKYGFTLEKWVRPFLADKSKAKHIIDRRLNTIFPLEDAFQCVALATRCVVKDPKDRPSSEDVLKSLEQIYSSNKS